MNFAKVKGQWPDLAKISSAKQDSSLDFYIISESNYDKIADIRGLKDNEAVVFGQILNFTSNYDYNGKAITITENNESFPLNIVDFKNFSISNSGMMRYAVVVTD